MSGTLSKKYKFPRKTSEVHGRWKKWIKLKQQGLNPNQIALLYGVGHSSVRYGLKRAQEIIEIYGKLW